MVVRTLSSAPAARHLSRMGEVESRGARPGEGPAFAAEPARPCRALTPAPLPSGYRGSRKPVSRSCPRSAKPSGGEGRGGGWLREASGLRDRRGGAAGACRRHPRPIVYGAPREAPPPRSGPRRLPSPPVASRAAEGGSARRRPSMCECPNPFGRGVRAGVRRWRFFLPLSSRRPSWPFASSRRPSRLAPEPLRRPWRRRAFPAAASSPARRRGGR